MSRFYAAFAPVVLLAVPAGLGCGQSKFDATLHGYNAWVSHSKAFGGTYNRVATPTDADRANDRLRQGLRANGLGHLAAGPPPPKDVNDADVDSLARSIDDFTVPDRDRVDPRIVEGIEAHLAAERELVEALRASNAAIRAPGFDQPGSGYMKAVEDSTARLNGAVDRLGAEAGKLEQLMRQIASDSGRKLK